MNQLIEKIRSRLHGEKVKPFMTPVTMDVTKETEAIGPHGVVGYGYTIDLVFSMQGYCASEKELGYLNETFMKAVKREMYDEIDWYFRQLEVAIYNRDMDKSMMLLRDMRNVIG